MQRRKKETDAMEAVVVLCLWSFALLLSGASATGVVIQGRGDGRGNVTYDGRSLIVNGEHRIIFSGSIHYPRSTPQMWPSLIAKAKAGGLDAIDTYVFWNIHEPQPGKFDFSGRRDLVRFIKEVQAQGLHVCLRIGPFIQGEWTYGGLPFWLHDVPGIVFRSDNKPFQFHMEKYVRKIVKMMKAKKLYASQGGPIILSQIENEYGTVEAKFGKKGPAYVRWAAKMAVRLHTGVPWVMCKQNDAPDPVINTCNGMRCGQTFSGPNSPNKPALWTENWTTYYQVYGEEPRLRSAEVIAFHVALFIAKGGSYVNYYMYHGGTNFGRTASPYVLTAYYDQAPLDEYGLLRQPKWGHLKELHAAIKSGTRPLLYGEHKNVSLGRLQQAYVFRGNPGECAAFIINYDGRENAVVDFENSKYYLPPKSISILPDCKTVVFNTAQVSTQYGTRSASTSLKFDSINQWQEYKEVIPTFAEASFRANTLLEQMNVTKDSTDYLWYTFGFQHHSSEARAVLTVNSRAHKLLVFVNGVFAGSVHGSPRNREFTLQQAVSLRGGKNHVSLLSAMVGLPDSGPYLERRVAGLRRVRIQCGKELKDFTNAAWGYKVGLLGEKTQVYTESGSKQVEWSKFRSSTHEPLKWYKTQFDAPEGKDPVALNLGSMGKGGVWVNGQSIGRYWVSFLTPKGHPSQTWYNVPRSFLKPKGNFLVLLEEEDGNPLGISIDSISTSKVCSRLSDSYPPPMSSWRGQQQRHSKGARLRLHCPPGKNISRILFSSFGTPSGDCQNYATGSCHSSNSTSVVEKVCLGKRKCSIPVSSPKFSADPCPGIPKSLLVDAMCT